MAEAIKVLGQLSPAATTLSTLYTVPALTSTVISTITICNRAGAATTFRLSVAVAGAADAVQQYSFYDTPLDPNQTLAPTLGITLGAGDVVRCYSGNGSVSFNAFGSETS